MESFFNIRYEFDKKEVHNAIFRRLKESGSDYICVSDGNILNNTYRNKEYLDVINGGMFSICDSSYVPVYLKWIYGIKRTQYAGSDIFYDIVKGNKYRMIFLGTQQSTLDSLKKELKKINPSVENMTFKELPFLPVEDFDYEGIAKMIDDDKAEIIWIALGAPKQERFMALLKPHLHHGIMIAIGATFNFFSGLNIKRAPAWMVRNHLEFIYRIYSEPRKQIKRCWGIISTLPALLRMEYRHKSARSQLPQKDL
ncbi:MAG: WecB/TagA/CpsF family glycosyltransferase [Muribaculaceae bacterium]|nr:WecB/TagA/CpsF family glycosyltransferase [Muribaculaceae bacterium]